MDQPNNKLGILSLQFYSYPDEVGGAWRLTYEVNKRLVEKGHRVFLITCKPTPDLPDYEVIDGVHYYRVGLRQSKSVINFYWELKKIVNIILEKQVIDLIHSHNPLVDFLTLSVSSLWGIPRIYHFHSLWYDEEKINRCSRNYSRFKLLALLNVIRLIEWTCFYVARSMLFLSQYTRGRFLEFYPLRKNRSRVIPGGVDTELFKPFACGSPECRKQLDLPKDIPILLTVRRLAARMGLVNLISACAIIVRRNPSLKFFLVIVGKGELIEQLKSQITQNCLQDYIRLTGPVSSSQLPLYYGAADLFILPTSSIEGFGLATAEALSSGLPVLGTPVGGTVEILNAIDSRLLFKSTTAEAIAAGVEKFLKNPPPFLELKERCREQAVMNYEWDKVVDRLEDEFYQVARTAKKSK